MKKAWLFLVGLVLAGLVVAGLAWALFFRDTTTSSQEETVAPFGLVVESEMAVWSVTGDIDEARLQELLGLLDRPRQGTQFYVLGEQRQIIPATIRVVFRDIAKIAGEDEARLYGRVTNGGQVMSGYAVSQTEGGDIEFRVYQNPEVYEAYPTSEALTEALNRVVFDLLYETLVGNKLRNQQDYELKRDWAFPQQSGNPPLFEVRREVSGWGQVRRVAGILRDVLAPPLCHNSSDQAGGHLAAI